MAINIKELFNADADNIKVDKINYNFDQLLANGGGPAGIKGDQGVTGNTGTKGQKGEIGNKGDEGSKGEQGTSANLWDRDDLTSGSNDFTVLRPYNLEGGGASDFRTRVIIGQDTSIAIDTTATAPTSLLNLVLPPISNNDVSSQLSFINDETGDPREFKMATDYEVGTGSTFTFSAASPVSGEETNLTISMPNNISLNAKTINLSAANDIDIENTSIGNITIGNLSGETYDVRLFSDNLIRLQTNDIELESSSIVANAANSININTTATSGTIDLSSDTTTLTAVVKNILTAPDNVLTATGNNTMSSAATGAANILNTTSTNGLNVLQNSGNDSFITEEGLNTSTQNIFFSVPNGDHDGNTDEGINPNEVSSGDGIQFKEGAASSGGVAGNTTDHGYYGAPNNGSNVVNRTLSDYFYEDSVTSVGGGIYYADNFAAGNGGNGTWDTLDVKSLATPNTHNREYSYVKIGNVVHVWGEIEIAVNPGSQATVWSGETDPLLILLNNPTGNQSFRFPYVNASNSYVDVNVRIRQNSETAGQSGGNDNYFTTAGRIKPGDNRIVLWKYGSFQDGSFAKWHFLKFSPSELYDGSTGGAFTISYNFSMPVNWNSYNRVFEAGINTSEQSGGGPNDETSGGGSSQSSTSSTEIEMFSNNPNSDAQEQPMTIWSTQAFAGNGGTFTQTFYSNMDHSSGGITFSNLPSWVTSASLSGATSFPSSFPNLSGSTVYMWTLSVTLLGNAGSNTRFASMDIVSDDPSTWSLPSGVSTWNISQLGL